MNCVGSSSNQFCKKVSDKIMSSYGEYSNLNILKWELDGTNKTVKACFSVDDEIYETIIGIKNFYHCTISNENSVLAQFTYESDEESDEESDDESDEESDEESDIDVDDVVEFIYSFLQDYVTSLKSCD